jgi:hypothetical protein
MHSGVVAYLAATVPSPRRLARLVGFISRRLGVDLRATRILERERTVGLRVSAINFGRSAVRVDLVELRSYSISLFCEAASVGDPGGPDLPVELKSGCSYEWLLAGSRIETFLWRHDHNRITVIAEIGPRRRRTEIIASDPAQPLHS